MGCPCSIVGKAIQPQPIDPEPSWLAETCGRGLRAGGGGRGSQDRAHGRTSPWPGLLPRDQTTFCPRRYLDHFQHYYRRQPAALRRLQKKSRY